MNVEKSHYLWMRRTIGAIIILMLPLCLMFNGISALAKSNGNADISWWVHLSVQYYTIAKPIMIGALMTSAVFFLTYKGYDWKDKLFFTLSGISLILTTCFPCGEVDAIGSYYVEHCQAILPVSLKVSQNIHMLSGLSITVIWFIIIRFLFTKSNGEKTEKKELRNKCYKILAYTMICSFFSTSVFVVLYNMFHLSENFLNFAIVGQILNFTSAGLAFIIKGEGLKILND